MELAATETGIGGIFFGLVGIPGLILMVIGGAMSAVDRRTDPGTADRPATPPGKKLFLLGLTMLVVTGVLAGVSAWLLS